MLVHRWQLDKLLNEHSNCHVEKRKKVSCLQTPPQPPSQPALQIPSETALHPCMPQPPHSHTQLNSVVQYGRRENTDKQQKTLPAKSPSKLLCFPEMVMLLPSLGRFLNCCFSQYLYSGCGYLIVGRDRLCWWQNVGCPQAAGERHDTELQVKKHSLYFLLFLMAKTIWCYI